jgi:hypothetical protein
LGVEADITTGRRGQFDILVNGKTVVSRKGGLLAMIFRKPWPEINDVVRAVEAAK